MLFMQETTEAQVLHRAVGFGVWADGGEMLDYPAVASRLLKRRQLDDAETSVEDEAEVDFAFIS